MGLRLGIVQLEEAGPCPTQCVMVSQPAMTSQWNRSIVTNFTIFLGNSLVLFLEIMQPAHCSMLIINTYIHRYNFNDSHTSLSCTTIYLLYIVHVYM